MNDTFFLLKVEYKKAGTKKVIILQKHFIKMKQYIIFSIAKRINILKILLEEQKKKAFYLKMI